MRDTTIFPAQLKYFTDFLKFSLNWSIKATKSAEIQAIYAGSPATSLGTQAQRAIYQARVPIWACIANSDSLSITNSHLVSLLPIDHHLDAIKKKEK